MDQQEALKKSKQYSDLVGTILKHYQVFLYGSYAKNEYRENSDIDLAVIVDKIPGDILQLLTKLYKLRRQIDEKIEPILFEKDNDKSGFLELILKNGILISKK